MTAQIHVITRNSAPQKRSCATCRYRPKTINTYTHCSATGEYVYAERRNGLACGPEGHLWDPPPPRLGVVGQIKRLLWGDDR